MANLLNYPAGYLEACKTAADQIGIEWQYLDTIIFFETTNRDPKKKNNAGGQARGYIQFMNATARGLGFASAQDLVDRCDTPAKQFPIVVKYFKNALRNVQLPTDEKDKLTALYLCVIYPAAAKHAATPSRIFFAPGTSAYKSNKGLDRDKDGAVSIGELAKTIQDRYQLLYGGREIDGRKLTPADIARIDAYNRRQAASIARKLKPKDPNTDNTTQAVSPVSNTYSHPMCQVAETYLGVAEEKGAGNNPVIMNFAKTLGNSYQGDGTAWCALFLNFCAYQAGFEAPFRKKGLNSLASQDWLKVGVEVAEPAAGDIIVMKHAGKGGHVMLATAGKNKDGAVPCISGNYSNKVAKHTYVPNYKGDIHKAYIRLASTGDAKVKLLPESQTGKGVPVGEEPEKKGSGGLLVLAAIAAKALLFS